jgi:hypothetical protein
MSNFNNFNNPPRYCLEKGSKKYYCPECNKKTFVRYIDTTTGNYLPEQYGRCDRESKCAYHLNPYLDGYAQAIRLKEQGNGTEFPKRWKQSLKVVSSPQTSGPVYFDFETFRQSLQPDAYEKNTFIQNLFYWVRFPFEVSDITKVVQLYRLGTVFSGYMAGAITFPFIDIRNNVRAIQVKQFDEQNHTIATNFLHSIIEKHHIRSDESLPGWLEAYKKQDKLISCLFGEHLLGKYPGNPVALVEAPKTAIYGTLYFGLPEIPESLIWLAVYNKSSFSFDKLKILHGRFVYVFPDLSKDGDTFREWETKAKDYESRLPGTRFIFSDLLERLAPEQDKSNGYDLADYLITQDWRLFRKRNNQEKTPQPEPEKVTLVTEVTHQQNILLSHDNPIPESAVFETERIEPPQKELLQNWSNIISELESYFASNELPTQPITLNQCSVIKNCSLFIESHLAVVKANNGKRTFLPYLNRLLELKQVLSMNSKC